MSNPQQPFLLVQLFPNILAIPALFLLLQQVGNIPGLEFLGLNTMGGLCWSTRRRAIWTNRL